MLTTTFDFIRRHHSLTFFSPRVDRVTYNCVLNYLMLSLNTKDYSRVVICILIVTTYIHTYLANQQNRIG